MDYVISELRRFLNQQHNRSREMASEAMANRLPQSVAIIWMSRADAMLEVLTKLRELAGDD